MVLLLGLGLIHSPRLVIPFPILLSVTVEQLLTRAGPAHVFKILTDVVVHGVYHLVEVGQFVGSASVVDDIGRPSVLADEVLEFLGISVEVCGSQLVGDGLHQFIDGPCAV